MGCDIHLFAEKKIVTKWWQFWKKTKWVSIDKYTKNPDFGKYEGEKEYEIAREDRFYTGGRSYNVFCALAGVRAYHFHGDPPCVSEPKGLPEDCCQEIRKESEDWGSDGHSHSWNTLRELQEFDWSSYTPTTDEFLTEVIPKMESVVGNPDHVRIVYWFDN